MPSEDAAELAAKLDEIHTEIEQAMDNIWEGGSISKSILIQTQEKVRNLKAALEAKSSDAASKVEELRAKVEALPRYQMTTEWKTEWDMTTTPMNTIEVISKFDVLAILDASKPREGAAGEEMKA